MRTPHGAGPARWYGGAFGFAASHFVPRTSLPWMLQIAPIIERMSEQVRRVPCCVACWSAFSWPPACVHAACCGLLLCTHGLLHESVPMQSGEQPLFQQTLVLQYSNMLFVKVDVDKARVRASTSLVGVHLLATVAMPEVLQLQHPAL